MQGKFEDESSNKQEKKMLISEKSSYFGKKKCFQSEFFRQIWSI